MTAVRYNTSLNLRTLCNLVSALEINQTVRNGRCSRLHALAMPDAAAWFAVMFLDHSSDDKRKPVVKTNAAGKGSLSSRVSESPVQSFCQMTCPRNQVDGVMFALSSEFTADSP